MQKMLAAQVHIGTRNSDSQMQDYIWRRRHVSHRVLRGVPSSAVSSPRM